MLPPTPGSTMIPLNNGYNDQANLSYDSNASPLVISTDSDPHQTASLNTALAKVEKTEKRGRGRPAISIMDPSKPRFLIILTLEKLFLKKQMTIDHKCTDFDKNILVNF